MLPLGLYVVCMCRLVNYAKKISFLRQSLPLYIINWCRSRCLVSDAQTKHQWMPNCRYSTLAWLQREGTRWLVWTISDRTALYIPTRHIYRHPHELCMIILLCTRKPSKVNSVSVRLPYGWIDRALFYVLVGRGWWQWGREGEGWSEIGKGHSSTFTPYE